MTEFQLIYVSENLCVDISGWDRNTVLSYASYDFHQMIICYWQFEVHKVWGGSEYTADQTT